MSFNPDFDAALKDICPLIRPLIQAFKDISKHLLLTGVSADFGD